MRPSRVSRSPRPGRPTVTHTIDFTQRYIGLGRGPASNFRGIDERESDVGVDAGVPKRAIAGVHGAARGSRRGAGPDHRHPGGNRHRRRDGEAGGRGTGHRDQPQPPGRSDRGDGRPRPLHLHAAASRALQARGPGHGVPARRAHRARAPGGLHPSCQPDPHARGGGTRAAGGAKRRRGSRRERGQCRVGCGHHPGLPGHHPDDPRLRGDGHHHSNGATRRGWHQPGRCDVAREQLHARRPPGRATRA